jgi:hypothetical protein
VAIRIRRESGENSLRADQFNLHMISCPVPRGCTSKLHLAVFNRRSLVPVAIDNDQLSSFCVACNAEAQDPVSARSLFLPAVKASAECSVWPCYGPQLERIVKIVEPG